MIELLIVFIAGGITGLACSAATERSLRRTVQHALTKPQHRPERDPDLESYQRVIITNRVFERTGRGVYVLVARELAGLVSRDWSEAN